MTWFRRLAGAVLAAAVLVDCSGSSAALPVLVPTCVRPDLSSPRPCTPQEYRRSQEQVALVDEATAVWQRQLVEDHRLTFAGGVASLTPTPEIEATMADPGKTLFMDGLVQLYDSGITVVQLEHRLKTRWDPTPIHAEALVTLQGCVDDYGSIYIDRDGRDLGERGIILERWGFKRVDGQLKMSYPSYEAVEACPF